jgi:hypothetical protein
MTAPLIAIAAMLAFGTLFVLLPVALDSYRRFRRRRVVTCPETKAIAEIVVDARRAACSSFFGEPRLRIRECTRWLQRKYCAQNCLSRL